MPGRGRAGPAKRLARLGRASVPPAVTLGVEVGTERTTQMRPRQTEEYYQALKLRKVDSVLVRVQDEFHGAGNRHPSNRMRRMLYVQQWFERHKSEGTRVDR